MAITNRERVGKGLELLRVGLMPFVELQFEGKFGKGYRDIVEARFNIKKNPGGALHWDNQAILKMFMIPEVWKEVIEPVLGKGVRNYAGELLEVRNRHAHDEAFSSEQAERALDTMRLLLGEVGAAEEAEKVQQIRYELQRVVFSDMARQKVRSALLIDGTPKTGLQPWRDVVTPHQDVVTGRYVQAEFAADLHNVHNGIGGPEYTDPEEFFRRTFITEGLKELLGGALERLSGRGGDPVVELQTNFGGGKTHAMLALYHLFGGTPATKLSGMESILKEVGIAQTSKANRAVLVGTHMSVGQVSKKSDGTEVRTLWGEMAWQFGGRKTFDLLADSDANGTSPGADVLTTLFRQAAPCMVLIDEWVAYSRNTVDRRDLPSGDFEAQATFAQALTEAAKTVDQMLVVASIPSSDIEVGGQNGKHALTVLKNVFERVGKTWRPASADEGFEIVRRRLFEPIVDKARFAERDAIIDAFSRMYAENKADFPSGCSEGSYRRKLEAAYPLHPDVFEQLYGEWSTLDKFQRTRGVLRLLAKVIHRLWESSDKGLLILPASVPMDDPSVKSELTRYLDDVWEPIISEDVDGPQSLPLELDRQNPTLGRYSACRRVARTLYIGTAPGSTGKNPGIDDRQVRLGCTQPGEHAATFGDALRRISDRAKHIHQDGNRHWVSTKANLNRLAEDRANSLLQEPERLHAEVVARIRDECKSKPNRGDFAGVHPCPEGTSEVDDEPMARLVILGPQFPHRKGQTDTTGMKFSRTLLDQRGKSPRINRNMVVFLAPDEPRVDELLQAVAQFLAWKSIQDEHEPLNLDAFQRRMAETKVLDTDGTVAGRIKETWTLALVPTHKESVSGEQTKPEDLVNWDEIRIAGADALGKRTSAKLKTDGILVPALGGTTLRHHLDGKLWKDKDHVVVGQCVEWFARYLYLPRLVNGEVLFGAVRDGLGGMLLEDTFAVAASFDEDEKRYRGLTLRGSTIIENTTLLVKPDVAKAQSDEDQKQKCPKCREPEPAWDPTAKKCSSCGYAAVEPPKPECPKCGKQEPDWSPTARKCSACGYEDEKPLPRCPKCGATSPVWDEGTRKCRTCDEPVKPNLFVGSVKLDGARLGRDAGRVAEEIIQHLSTQPGARVEVRLEMQVRVPNGVPDDVVRTVSENARTLKFDSAVFEKE